MVMNTWAANYAILEPNDGHPTGETFQLSCVGMSFSEAYERAREVRKLNGYYVAMTSLTFMGAVEYDSPEPVLPDEPEVIIDSADVEGDDDQ